MSTQTDVERLRGIFLKQARESYDLTGVEWQPWQNMWEIANLMPSFYGLIRAVRDDVNPYRAWDEETLKLELQNLGFTSAQALLGTLNQMRESLKSELSEKDWETFFNSTLDIT